METLQTVISRHYVLYDQTWHISPEGVHIEEPGMPPLLLSRAQIRGFGLPEHGRGGGINYVVLAFDGAQRVERLLIPILNGSVHGQTGARQCYDALCRAMPERDLGWGTVPSFDFHVRLGVPIPILPFALFLLLTLLVFVVGAAVFLSLR